MSLRLSSSQTSFFVSLWGGLGIPGDEVPTDGDNGGSPLANDGISPTSEYRIETVTAPSAGTLTVYPDTSYLFEGAPDGSYDWVYRVFEDSIDRGVATETFVIGSPVASFSTTTSLPVFSGGASVSGTSPVAVFNTTTALPSFSGSAHVSPVAVFSTVTASPVFVGGASIDGASPIASFNSTTELPLFSGAVSVSPVAAFSSATTLPVFNGSASVVGSPAAFSFATITTLPTFSGGAVVAGIVWPPTSDVRLGVTYGPTGTEYTGTMTGTSGPSASDIAAAVVAAMQTSPTPFPSNVTHFNGNPTVGSGTPADPVRPA